MEEVSSVLGPPGVPGSSERSQVFMLGITLSGALCLRHDSVMVRRSPGFPLATFAIQKLKQALSQQGGLGTAIPMFALFQLF